MATFYCNSNGASPAYSVSLSYGTVTRSGNTVTIRDIKISMSSISVGGSNYQTTNRLAYRCGIGGGSQTNIANNTTLHFSGSLADKSYTINIGTRTVSVGATATSFTFYFALASTGYSSGWDNFQGNSPCVIFNGNISCPAGQPTWTTQPTASAVNETQINVSLGATDMSSTKTIFYKKSSDSSYTSTTSTTLTGLTANTTYNIYVRASANSFNVNSNTLTVTTYKYPSLSSISPSSGNIGTGVTLNFSNPLSRELTIKMQYCLTSGGTYTDYKDGGSSVKTWTSSGTSLTVTPTASALYNLIPNQTSIYVKFIVTYSTVTNDTSSVFTYNMVAADCAPSWTGVSASDITYYDGNGTITEITGNNQQIVQSKSNIYIKLGKAATTQYGATISSYTCTITGNATSQTLTVNTAKSMGTSTSGSTITVTIVARDSRGQTITITKNITNVIPYSVPSGAITLKRVNNWENQTTLTITPSWAINNNNSGTIVYKYKKSTDSSWSNNYTYNSQTTLNLDNQYSWDFSVVLTDRLGGTKTITGTVDKGAPIFFIDPTKLAVGVNKFPSFSGLDVEGELKMSKGLVPNWKMTLPTTSATTYYKIASGTMNTAESLNLIIFIQHGSNPHWCGTCLVNLSSNGSEVSIVNCRWLTKTTSISNSKFRVCVDTKTWTLYLSKNSTDSGTYYITELSRRNENGLLPVNAITYTTTVEAASGTPSGATANANSAFYVDVLVNYPVGSIYITTGSTSPASLFGGTWTHINSRFLYSASSETAATTGTGGSSSRSITLTTANLPGHTHSIPSLSGTAASAGGHSHVVTRATTSYAAGSQSSWRCLSWAGTSHDYSDVVSSESAGAHTHSVTTNANTSGSTGSGSAFTVDTLPPYFIVHMWRRTA